MAAQSAANKATSDKVADLNDRADEWDLASRVKLYGDFRARMDYYNAETASGKEFSNDTVWTNRFRLNMRVSATENVEFKGRLAMYKSWGDAFMYGGTLGDPTWDGNSTRTPDDNTLRVDRAFVNFNNIGGAPVWFSIGRRPTTDGNPANIRMNLSERSGTPLIMDYPFDGVSLGYAYSWGGDIGNGRVRICYGRGFEDGLQEDDGVGLNANGIDDTDFIGLSWDILQKGDRFLYAQSFLAANVPGATHPNAWGWDITTTPPTPIPSIDNDGNILHSGLMYMDKIAGLNYFIAGGWSRTDPNENGLFNDYPGFFTTGTGINTDSEDGYHAHLGIRYDIDPVGLKLGAEWNYGSKYWVGMTPGHDDLYASKIAARGNVYEVYGIYDLPTGPAISKYAKTFMRLGYQRYEYDYTGSNDWTLMPYSIDSLYAQGIDAIETADQVYLTLEVAF
jgi:hypothetical protein